MLQVAVKSLNIAGASVAADAEFMKEVHNAELASYKVAPLPPRARTAFNFKDCGATLNMELSDIAGLPAAMGKGICSTQRELCFRFDLELCQARSRQAA